MAPDRIMELSSLILACAIKAATAYGLPPAGVVAILEVEGGRTGEVSENSNGTRDIGLMQVNSLWLEPLAKTWGVSRDEAEVALRDRPCTNIAVGTFILAECIHKRGGDFWQGVGCYHAPSDAERARAYAARVAGKAAQRFGPQVFRPER